MFSYHMFGVVFTRFLFCLYSVIFLFFFFFQAEDGIRDGTVTGVQTCALPISARASRRRARSWRAAALLVARDTSARRLPRSEASRPRAGCRPGSDRARHGRDRKSVV